MIRVGSRNSVLQHPLASPRRTIRLRRSKVWLWLLYRHTGFSNQPANSTCAWRALVFLTVNRMTVAGNDESSTLSGTNGENASSETATGEAVSQYSTKPMGYSPLKEMSLQPLRSSARTCVSPPCEIITAKPWSNGEAGCMG